jgi:hypothetical protein
MPNHMEFRMLRRMMLAISVVAVTIATAGAADLPVQSRLGAVFADPLPSQAPAAYGYRSYGHATVYAPQVDIQPLVAGYYGKPNSYYYAPYYGGSLYYNFARLPYACGLYGYC